ncbi:MAG: NAD(P)H-binding protein [Rugosibacter sp.]|nr:NAD(P)H-binding protein [Rugosibacter sp.]
MKRLLIIGCGDVVRRVVPELTRRWQVLALVRHHDAALTALGVRQIVGDLDRPASLRRLAGVADAVIHSAPPSTASDPASAPRDLRTRHLVAALRRGKSLPRHFVYISTSGVYGDCAGASVPETRPLAAKSARALRRLDAERCLREFGRRSCCVGILRAPGIYAADRLPLERLRQGLPLVEAAADGYSNHIHAVDLGRACLAALRRARPNRSYNVSDDSQLKMGEWFDLLADRFHLPRAPRLPRAEVATRVPEMQWSFMSESRRLENARMKHELGLRLRYPTVNEGIMEATCSG